MNIFAILCGLLSGRPLQPNLAAGEILLLAVAILASLTPRCYLRPAHGRTLLHPALPSRAKNGAGRSGAPFSSVHSSDLLVEIWYANCFRRHEARSLRSRTGSASECGPSLPGGSSGRCDPLPSIVRKPDGRLVCVVDGLFMSLRRMHRMNRRIQLYKREELEEMLTRVLQKHLDAKSSEAWLKRILYRYSISPMSLHMSRQNVNRLRTGIVSRL